MNYSSLSIDQKLKLIFELYTNHGHEDYIGEPVSQIEHMCQSAQLAEREGFDSEVILAAFFHDIGHLLNHLENTESLGGFGVKRHEQIGADFLRSLGFPEKIPQLVENHVQAKRYLTFRFPEYLEKLSEASKKTLEFQGGPMDNDEALAFENDHLFDISLLMRNWDEEAKDENIPLPDLEKYISLAREVLYSCSEN
ncbi:MAG: phosphonate degradation operon associated HDIG domain protein [Algoriphagus marincola HL-49]|uniref:Phosphonate degradation operon associated HDIG domain protein n=1 Tax=Algoriphagus marincola HL-49 TaxID=1305737 RepID=A0A0P7Y1D7_9BACT|nr:MAG: phosphonate degradation operon associated HDIG domain protein [Algoriphagus marincola HL-49]